MISLWRFVEFYAFQTINKFDHAFHATFQFDSINLSHSILLQIAAGQHCKRAARISLLRSMLYRNIERLWINFHLIKTLQTCPNERRLALGAFALSNRMNEFVVNARFGCAVVVFFLFAAATLFNLWDSSPKMQTNENKYMLKTIKIKSTIYT